MYQPLKLHPDSVCHAVERIEVSVSRTDDDGLYMLWLIAGQIDEIALPPAASPDRTDDLWKHTCLEAFVRPYGDERYYEINMATSGQWATYAFDSYRTGMRPALETTYARANINRRQGRFLNLSAAVGLKGLNSPPDKPWRVGISAVIEETNGTKSYWALAHPQGKPDFHHAGGFILDLSKPGAT